MSLTIEFLPHTEQQSAYDWVDISMDGARIGKARCKLNEPDSRGKTIFIIYSINIYPEWAGHGYGKAFVDYCKSRFEIVIADRVRFTAIGFWEAVGFHGDKDGNWTYRRPDGE